VAARRNSTRSYTFRQARLEVQQMATNTRRARVLSLTLLAAALAAPAAVTARAAADGKDNKIGKWKLRAEAPARGAREYEDRGCGVTVSIRQGVNARGQEYYSSYAAKVDGKEYPRFVKGSTGINTIAFTQVDPDTVAYTLRENGKITATGTTNVSKDGKVLTVTTKSVNGSGAGNSEIYDRIP
jgi:hypothetical protein